MRIESAVRLYRSTMCTLCLGNRGKTYDPFNKKLAFAEGYRIGKAIGPTVAKIYL